MLPRFVRPRTAVAGGRDLRVTIPVAAGRARKGTGFHTGPVPTHHLQDSRPPYGSGGDPFAAADQRTLAALDTVVIDAARELVLDEETADTARLLRGRLPALSEQLQHLADGVAFEGMEALVTAIHPAPAYLPDFFPDGVG